MNQFIGQDPDVSEVPKQDQILTEFYFAQSFLIQIRFPFSALSFVQKRKQKSFQLISRNKTNIINI
ncbi:hypothetical protein T03_17953 [Trichinella britovi]|uniref:Uncharacterized protein n=1 Tax=Trichinella britovi TaxID=45882 RepID=A0A0V1CA06_TRIBR|nr:hypothetical protein T03_17953 [Trichinella britovi]